MMKIVGHRGAKGLAPENTIASLLKAIEHGVDEIECDVHITKDNVPILIHDTHLQDAAGNKLEVSHYTYEELQTHKVDLPTLAQAIIAVNRQVPLQIEVKPTAEAAPVVKVVQRFLDDGWQPEDFLFGSFRYATLKELRRLLPEVPLVVIDRWSGVRATSRARRLGTKRLSMNRRWLWSGFIRSIRRGGYELYPYTVNDKALAKRWFKAGIAGIITDLPDRFEP